MREDLERTVPDIEFIKALGLGLGQLGSNESYRKVEPYSGLDKNSEFKKSLFDILQQFTALQGQGV